MDFVFTVCDNAAGETCPVWPGQPMTAHWGIEDPAAVDGPDIQKEAAFVAAFRYMKNRISAFTSLPVASLDKASLRTKLPEIGQSDGATSPRNSTACARTSVVWGKRVSVRVGPGGRTIITKKTQSLSDHNYRSQ